MDRINNDASLGGLSLSGDGLLSDDGPLTRSIGDVSTSGFIPKDAVHWAIEPFIPVDPSQWEGYLLRRVEITDQQRTNLEQAARKIEQAALDCTASQQCQFATNYRAIDPDRDTQDLFQLADDEIKVPAVDDVKAEAEEKEDEEAVHEDQALIDSTIGLSERMLQEAGYTRLDQDQIEQCVGVASQWGVPLHVDFALFKRLVVFARGDIVGTRVRRRWNKFYRREMVDVPIYQRMVVMFLLRKDQDAGESLSASSLHLRMFKNIPKQDIDMLLPGTRVRISGVDRVKIVLPSLGGLLMSARKIASYALLFAVLALHWAAILAVLVIGYLIKSFLSYFQTKKRYQLNLTRNLYFQKLDTNAGVGFHLASQATSQKQVEWSLAYFAILTHDQPISVRKLRRKCERIVREAIDLEIDFQVDRAVAGLQELDLLVETDDGFSIATS